MYGEESSRTIVHGKLAEAREQTGKDWLFDPDALGRSWCLMVALENRLTDRSRSG
jgi:hypothetical protein